MRRDWKAWTVACVGALGLLTGCASTEAETDGGGGDAAEAPLDPMQEMAEWMALQTPNENHTWLQKGAGNYDVVGRMWMAPDAPPMEMTGTAEFEAILEGRYLRQTFHGDFMGQPFTGISLEGYDNQKGKFVSIWMDSASTGFFFSEGTRDADGILTLTGEMADARGNICGSRSVMWAEPDGITRFDMFETRAGRPERKIMELTYTPRK